MNLTAHRIAQQILSVFLATTIVACSDPSDVSLTGDSDDQNSGVEDNNGNTNNSERFGDRYWAKLAQNYAPYEAPSAASDPTLRGEQGSWGPVVDWPLVATGAANLPDGRILGWSSTSTDNFSGGGFTLGTIYDAQAGTFTPARNDNHNMFCSGVSMLPDGRVFSAGGGGTVKTTSVFSNNAWSTLTDEMTFPRWYNTSTTLPSGQVLSSLGTNSTGASDLWTEGAGWNQATGFGLQTILADTGATSGPASWFPALSVAPSGKVFHSGPTNQMHLIDLTSNNGLSPMGGREIGNHHRLYGTNVMYDVGKILLAGGRTPAMGSAITIDINGSIPQVTDTNPLNLARTFQNRVVLPNGEVLVIGGNSDGVQFSDTTTVLTPEIWNPQTGIWKTLAPHAEPRNYHSTALLLKDGRVAVMGGGLCGGCATNHKNGEIFDPPLFVQR